jgi:hypothetical protein
VHVLSCRVCTEIRPPIPLTLASKTPQICGDSAYFDESFGPQGSHAPALRAGWSKKTRIGRKLLFDVPALTPKGKKWGCMFPPIFRP